MSLSSSRVIKELWLSGENWHVVRPKSGQGAGAALDLAPSAEEILVEAQLQAESLVIQAQARARKLVAEAEEMAAASLEECQRRGLTQGREEGRREGQAAAHAQNEASAAALVALVRAADEEQLRLLSGMEAQLVDLAFRIARRIVGESLSLSPESVTEVVAHAIAEAHGSGHHVIRLHADDAELVEPFLPRAAIEAGGREWDVVADSALSRGDCLIETAFGIVDACIETQLRELARQLRGSDDEAPER